MTHWGGASYRYSTLTLYAIALMEALIPFYSKLGDGVCALFLLFCTSKSGEKAYLVRNRFVGLLVVSGVAWLV